MPIKAIIPELASAMACFLLLCSGYDVEVMFRLSYGMDTLMMFHLSYGMDTLL